MVNSTPFEKADQDAREMSVALLRHLEAKGMTKHAIAQALGTPWATFGRQYDGHKAFDFVQVCRMAELAEVAFTVDGLVEVVAP